MHFYEFEKPLIINEFMTCKIEKNQENHPCVVELQKKK